MAHTLRCIFSCRPGCNRRFSVVSNLRRHFKVHGRKAAATAAFNASTCLRPLACSSPTLTSIQQQEEDFRKQKQLLSSPSASSIKSPSPSLSVKNRLESWSLIQTPPLDASHLQLQPYGNVSASTSTPSSIQTSPTTSVLADREFMPPSSTLFDLPIMDYDPAAASTSTSSQTQSLYPVFDAWLSMPLLADLSHSPTATLGWFE
ncbi:hypothetical protein K492DRAFT_190705 [Lichtheimia hyalospora FSU 10163]|nr:hypothetical protein K492DRAFT_190705 [Lichtheimia hyalospora FSU 10163]